MRALITGGSGFLGTALVGALAARGTEVTSADVIFHTAGILSAAAEARPEAAYQANVIGRFKVLEAAAAGRPGHP